MRKVLIVEDDPSTNDLLKSLVQTIPDTDVIQAFDKACAEEAMRNHSLALMVIDVKLGPRILAEDLGLIFDYGFSTRLDSEHMGLGLFTARVSILRMGGTINAENTADGVVFTVTLSRYLPEA